MSNNYLGRDNPDVLRAAHAGETLGLSFAEVAKGFSKVLAMHSLIMLQLGMPYQSKHTVFPSRLLLKNLLTVGYSYTHIPSRGDTRKCTYKDRHSHTNSLLAWCMGICKREIL